MSTTITFRRGTAAPTPTAGLTLGEPAFDTTNRNLYIGLGSGVTAAWVGARISGLSSDITAGLTNWIVNAKAIKDYVNAVTVTPENVAFVDQANTFTALQTFNVGISASDVSAAIVNTNQLLPRGSGPFILLGGGVDNGNANLAGLQFGSDSATYDLRYMTLMTSELTQGQTLMMPNESGTIAIRGANTFTGLQTLTAGLSASGATFSGNVTIGGNLTINGTTTTINSTTISVDDKNIVLADIASPTDILADGGGITLRGDTDKLFVWERTVNSGTWTSSENLTLATGKSLYINTTELLRETGIVFVDGGTYT